MQFDDQVGPVKPLAVRPAAIDRPASEMRDDRLIRCRGAVAVGRRCDALLGEPLDLVVEGSGERGDLAAVLGRKNTRRPIVTAASSPILRSRSRVGREIPPRAALAAGLSRSNGRGPAYPGSS